MFCGFVCQAGLLVDSCRQNQIQIRFIASYKEGVLVDGAHIRCETRKLNIRENKNNEK